MRKPRPPGLTQLGAGSIRTADYSALGCSDSTSAPKTAQNASVRDFGVSQTLVLDGFPTIGEVKTLGPNGGTSNRYALGKMRRAVQARVFVQVLRQGIRPVPPPVACTLRYVMPDDRHRDADNFAGIGKPVIDGLVKRQILAGDNAARLALRVEFVKEPGARRLEVVIESMEVRDGDAAGV